MFSYHLTSGTSAAGLIQSPLDCQSEDSPSRFRTEQTIWGSEGKAAADLCFEGSA